jgi:hypothetical protein
MHSCYAKKKGKKSDHTAGVLQFPANKLVELWMTALARHEASC